MQMRGEAVLCLIAIHEAGNLGEPHLHLQVIGGRGTIHRIRLGTELSPPRIGRDVGRLHGVQRLDRRVQVYMVVAQSSRDVLDILDLLLRGEVI